MKAACILYSAISSVPDRGFVMFMIISDGNNVMRAHLRYPNIWKGKQDKGRLPLWIFEPEFS